MSVIINAKGTSVPYFTIGKHGTTVYQGLTNPSQSAPVKDGDIWVNTESTSLMMRRNNAWVVPNLDNIQISGSTITSLSSELLLVPPAGGQIKINGLSWPSSSGSEGQVLTTNGNGLLSWQTLSGTGTVTSVSVSGTSGRIESTGSPITTSGTITLDLSQTGVTPGNYSLANVSIDAYGRITSASTGDLTNISSGISVADYVEFNTGATAPVRLQWNDDDGTLEFPLKDGNVTLQIGQEQVVRVYNSGGVALIDGDVVHIDGSQGQRLSVSKADASTVQTSVGTIGIVTEQIGIGAEGFVTTFGLVRNINTSMFSEGAMLWLGTTPGTISSTRPVAPYRAVLVGYCVGQHATTGSIFVKVRAIDNIAELSDVFLGPTTSGDLLSWTGLTWTNTTPSTVVSQGLPLQSGNSNKYLKTDGSSTYWDFISAAGNNTEIQFNSNGFLSSSGSFTWDNTTTSLVLGQNSLSSTIKTPDANEAATLNISSGHSVGTNGEVGSSVFVSAGNSASGPAGNVVLIAGNTTSYFSQGGNIGLFAGTGSLMSGSITLISGNAVDTGDAGNISITAGSTSGTGSAGSVYISSGSSSAATGNVIISTNGLQRLGILGNGAWSVGPDNSYTGTANHALLSAGPDSPPTWGSVIRGVSVNAANGLSGSSLTTGGNTALTLRTTVTGILKGNQLTGVISAAVAGTDYLNSVTLTGDVTGTGGSSISVTLATVGTEGTVGSSDTVPVITTDSKGRVTSVSPVTIQITESQIADGTVLARLASDESVSGNWSFTNPVTGQTPTNSAHLATKEYVDSLTYDSNDVSAQLATGVSAVYINSTSEVTLESSSDPLCIGTLSGFNLAIDSNEIQARNNSSSSDLSINPHGGKLTIGSSVSASPLRVVSGTVDTTVLADSFGSANPAYVTRKARGSELVPEAVVTNDILGTFGSRGYTGVGFTESSSAALVFRCSEDWSSTANGTKISFFSTPDSGVNRKLRLDIGQSNSTFYNNSELPTLTIGNDYTITAYGVLNIAPQSGNTGIEIGARGSANTSVIDFHTGATDTNYDVRIASWGGNGTDGNGNLSITSASTTFSKKIIVNDTFNIDGDAPSTQQDGLYVADLGGTIGTTNNPIYTAAICGQYSTNRSVAVSVDGSGYLWGFRTHTNAGSYTWQSKTKSADSITTAPDVNQLTGSVTTTSTSIVNLDVLPIATYRSAKYEIQIVKGSDVQVCEIRTFHDDTNGYHIEYGRSVSGSGLGTFSSDVFNGNLRLRFAAASATSTVVKFYRTALTV